MRIKPRFRRAVLCLIGSLAILAAFTACEKTAPITPNPQAAQPSAPADPETPDAGQPAETPADDDAQTIPAISGGVDSDADAVDGIPIRNASELSRIGTSAKFPLDGNYVLVADIDLSSVSSFTPIGGSESESGIVSGKNVFCGTFDGRGHTISGLKLAVSSSKRVHVGLFGSVGSDDKNSPAVIKNIILKDVTVRGNAAGVACYAALCGQCSGYVTVDNIALLSGTVEVTNKSGDLLGVAALIGQCRTDTNTGMTNNPIKITNIFSNISVTADNRGNSPYTSGIIGRIRGSDIGQLKNIVQFGTVTHEGTVGGGNAITTGDAGAKVVENVYYLAGCGVDNKGIGQAKSYESLSGGNLPLDTDVWHVAEGLYPMPEILYKSPYFAVVDFVALTLAEGETPDAVESDFPLTTTIMGKNITWNSDKPGVILIDQGVARVTKPDFGYETVKLTARADGVIKTYELRVFSGVYGEIERVGDTLYARNYPAGVTYKWIVKDIRSGKTVNTDSTKNDYVTLGEGDTNCMITLQVEGYDEVYYFVSSLPTVFINSAAGYNDISKGGYSSATMRIATTEKFPDTAYDGGIDIKVRGNSTAWAPKRPFKIKLDTKADLFGMGANKHWCLLANFYDRTNLRNKISYDFSMDLGLVGCESELVNLIFNGEYVGLYEFTEAIRVGETRVDIFDWEEEAEAVAKAIYKKEELSKEERTKLEDGLTRDLSWITTGVYGDYSIADYYDISGYDITGGYLLEDDAYFDETSKFLTTNDMKIMVKKPEYLRTNKEMMNYIQTYVQNTEDAVYAPNRLSKEGLHYSEYMDVDSFIDFWVVNTLYKNVELLFKSCYLYKPVGGKLTWGPVWDMDWTSANHVNLDQTSSQYNSWKQGQSQDREYWYKALYNDPWFVLQLMERWNSVGDKVDAMFAHYDEVAEEIKDAAESDNRLWGYDWKYTKEVSTLREWLVSRRGWMDEKMADPAVFIESLGYYKTSQKIDLTDCENVGGAYEITLSVMNGDGIASADVLLNGRVYQSDIVVKDGAVIRVEKADCRDAGLYNVVEVLTKDANGKYLAITKRSGEKGSNANEADYLYWIGN